jgi:hypothetical protein
VVRPGTGGLGTEAQPVPDGRETSRALHTIDVRDSGRSVWPMIPEYQCVRHAMLRKRLDKGGCGTRGLSEGVVEC